MVLFGSRSPSLAASIIFNWIYSWADFPVSFFHQIAEIIGRQAYFACKIAYRRQPFLRSGALGKVIVEQPLETCQDIEIHVPARDELALVKTHTIVEQQFYIGRNKPLGMLVDGVA